MQPILSVEDLRISFADGVGFTEVVKGISFNLEKGKVLGLVGESGSGKSVSAMSIIKLLPINHSKIKAKQITYFSDGNEINLLEINAEEMQKIRGKKIAVIFQDPMLALNPVQKVGKQIIEVFKLHRQDINPSDYQKEAAFLFEKVGIKMPEEKIKNYPHQLSGGMRQRVMIAIALASKPKILIADEPTTSLDATTAVKILSLLQDLQEEYQMSMLFISHDLEIVRAMSDDIAVMYQGKIVEQNNAEELINKPKHNYTKSLLGASNLVRGEV